MKTYQLYVTDEHHLPRIRVVTAGSQVDISLQFLQVKAVACRDTHLRYARCADVADGLHDAVALVVRRYANHRIAHAVPT